jgi:oligopeptide/dipeptide ABC transporter ATP-binding protein
VLYPDPTSTPARFVLEGEIPSPIHVPPACPLHTRCPLARPECATIPIRLEELAPGHASACTRAIAESWTTVPDVEPVAAMVGD